MDPIPQGDPPSAPVERRRRAFELLRDALEVDDDARDAWLAQRAGEDVELAVEVRALLRASGAHVLDHAAGDVAARLAGDDAGDDLAAGVRVGAWVIVAPLGSGGMGTVYLAQRDGDGYVQRGALKRIKRGMDSDAVLARFRRERQILSRLGHAAIAHLLDGGIAVDGRPYLVMEYIEGEALADWSARAEVGLDARVGLVLSLCAAVAHAHHQLVVHRDIKPANVLVAADGTPRLLDFGIARLLEADGDEAATATAARFVSRAYAAPEQLQGQAVTTATDIFQLGALLHELLTGLRPADAAPDTTTRPAQRLASMRVRAGQRGPAAVTPKMLVGDAGIIVARATDAEPTRRYATVEAFADDLRRWRAGRPILARPDSTGYRLHRFVARHRWLVALSAFAFCTLVGGAGIALWQAHVAERQQRIALERAETAERVKRFMIDLFQAPDPALARGAMPRADDLLDRGAAQITGGLAGQPRVQAELYETMALSYMGLGRFDTGTELLERARAALADVADPVLSMRVETRLGSAYAELGRYAEALSALDRALADDPATSARTDAARIESVRGWVLRDLGRYPESETALRRSLALAQSTPDDLNPAALRALNNLAYTLQLEGRKAESIATYQRVVDWFAAHEPADSQPRLWAEYTYAKSLRDLGEPARAREILERIRPLMLQVVGAAHADLAGLDIALGQAWTDLGDPRGYARVLDAVARSHAAVPQRNMLWANAEFALAEAEQRAQHAGAEAHYRAAQAAYIALVGASHPLARECARRMAQAAQARASSG